MNIRILLFLLLLTSLFGYLEWGTDKHSFLFETEYVVLSKLLQEPLSVLHPFTIFPLMGQIILLLAIFQKEVKKTWIYVGISAIALLLGLMFIIGILSMNFKIVISTIPFLTVATMTIKRLRSTK